MWTRKPFKPRYPHTHSPDWSSYISLRISEENLFKDQSIFLKVIILLILITFCPNDVLILLGENWCWSLLGLEENYNFNFVESGENSVVWPLCLSYFWHLLLGTMCCSVFYETKCFFLFNFDFWSDSCYYIWRRLPYLGFWNNDLQYHMKSNNLIRSKPRDINQPLLRKINTQFYIFSVHVDVLDILLYEVHYIWINWT